ncbi:MAG: hypothetical protein ACI92Z_003142 [Paracoccaceae bacterium]|jgi:hypothetical protein
MGIYYETAKDLMEAGKRQFACETIRAGTADRTAEACAKGA